MTEDALRDFVPVRPELVGLAYRMTGSRAQAEDIAQEAFLRWAATDRAAVEVPRAFLLKIAARLSLDHLKSAAHRREDYVGPWLPEPVVEDLAAPQQVALDQAQDLSVAFLLTLQRLSPAERAVFLLHDLFETPFEEIASLLGRSAPACRKLAERARDRLGTPVPRFAVAEEEAARIARAFFAASRGGDLAPLRDMLAEDVVLHTDGGGVRPAARNLITGADRVARFFLGLATKWPGPAVPLHVGRINALPGFVTREADGLPQTTALDWRDGRIVAIYVVRNPAKLAAIRAGLG
ncbi:sigma-70 family RNA polymerase sigma factor [Falsiroseomonas tokyonensis]|uniref:Sigma-70 family RNA polymerase sigma factor n=1 Tax=Falsiroseomonas tokyonensis TaxID=430521 RepID=A0ABV7BSZ2_9PROT|nr:sigma-70 family RNA polymerase sigma factor [Falsiroseomonas tokyonensis]MBU8537620.1 sigma-70 family RNA polymerase sigma factor [Falsiroseomonas tokyonensis]